MRRVRPLDRAEAAAVAGAGVAREVDCLILNLGGMCMLYNHIQNTHSILYLFRFTFLCVI